MPFKAGLILRRTAHLGLYTIDGRMPKANSHLLLAILYMTNAKSSGTKDRQDDTSEIEVTHEMASVGASLLDDALYGQPFAPDTTSLAVAVYKAMHHVKSA